MMLFDHTLSWRSVLLPVGELGISRSVARGAKGVANASLQQTAGMSGAWCGGGLCTMSEGRSFGGSKRQGMPSAAHSQHC
jgi:hypothetical protein